MLDNIIEIRYFTLSWMKKRGMSVKSITSQWRQGIDLILAMYSSIKSAVQVNPDLEHSNWNKRRTEKEVKWQRQIIKGMGEKGLRTLMHSREVDIQAAHKTV